MDSEKPQKLVYLKLLEIEIETAEKVKKQG